MPAPSPAVGEAKEPDIEFDGARIAAVAPGLTVHQLGILRWMAAGHSNAAIARRIGLSEDTVKSHARRIYRNLGARDRAHAVAIGFRLGLLTHRGTPNPLPPGETPSAGRPRADNRPLCPHCPARHRIP